MDKLKTMIKKPLAVMVALGICVGLALAACSDDTDHATSKLEFKSGKIALAADSEHLAH